jgi:cell division protein FtsI (penicillin-binding protein 3)
VVCARAAQVQVAQASHWGAIAEAQHRTDRHVAAPRGTILDRDGTPLAVSRERFRVSLAPGELAEVAAVEAMLREDLGLSAAKVASLTSPSRAWSVVPDLHPPAVRERFSGARGVYVDRELQRFHPHGDLARGVLGVVLEDEGRGGIEEAFDDLLGGVPGREIVARDHLGRAIPGERLLVEPPQPGGEVVLTLDMDLQEIARLALEEAIEQSQARGGDVLMTDPETGEILALVSIREGRTAALSAINTPYEPGSTLKPFTVAALLEHDLVSLHDTVDVGQGVWEVAGRTLHDDIGDEGRMSVGDALRVSSNIGIAKAAQVMSPRIQYETLRDFGFGVRTGIDLPGEVAGTLRRPEQWTAQSAASLAIGYEISVTPLQITMAYGALANGGRLMLPRLVREVRGADGAVIERFEPVLVRRVVDAGVARLVSRVLVDVVEDGTGTSARLGAFRVAGKSGTSRAHSGRGYERGAYHSVVLPPRAVAAPVTRATMEAALAARTTPLDRRALLRALGRERMDVRPSGAMSFAVQSIDPPAPPLPAATAAVGGRDRMGGPVVALSGAAAGKGSSAAAAVTLPDVSGLPSRVAVRRLHALGLRVSSAGTGEITGTVPSAGVRVLAGDTIRLRLKRGTDG